MANTSSTTSTTSTTAAVAAKMFLMNNEAAQVVAKLAPAAHWDVLKVHPLTVGEIRVADNVFGGKVVLAGVFDAGKLVAADILSAVAEKAVAALGGCEYIIVAEEATAYNKVVKALKEALDKAHLVFNCKRSTLAEEINKIKNKKEGTMEKIVSNEIVQRVDESITLIKRDIKDLLNNPKVKLPYNRAEDSIIANYGDGTGIRYANNLTYGFSYTRTKGVAKIKEAFEQSQALYEQLKNSYTFNLNEIKSAIEEAEKAQDEANKAASPKWEELKAARRAKAANLAEMEAEYAPYRQAFLDANKAKSEAENAKFRLDKALKAAEAEYLGNRYYDVDEATDTCLVSKVVESEEGKKPNFAFLSAFAEKERKFHEELGDLLFYYELTGDIKYRQKACTLIDVILHNIKKSVGKDLTERARQTEVFDLSIEMKQRLDLYGSFVHGDDSVMHKAYGLNCDYEKYLGEKIPYFVIITGGDQNGFYQEDIKVTSIRKAFEAPDKATYKLVCNDRFVNDKAFRQEIMAWVCRQVRKVEEREFSIMENNKVTSKIVTEVEFKDGEYQLADGTVVQGVSNPINDIAKKHIVSLFNTDKFHAEVMHTWEETKEARAIAMEWLTPSKGVDSRSMYNYDPYEWQMKAALDGSFMFDSEGRPKDRRLFMDQHKEITQFIYRVRRLVVLPKYYDAICKEMSRLMHHWSKCTPIVAEHMEIRKVVDAYLANTNPLLLEQIQASKDYIIPAVDKRLGRDKVSPVELLTTIMEVVSEAETATTSEMEALYKYYNEYKKSEGDMEILVQEAFKGFPVNRGEVSLNDLLKPIEYVNVALLKAIKQYRPVGYSNDQFLVSCSKYEQYIAQTAKSIKEATLRGGLTEAEKQEAFDRALAACKDPIPARDSWNWLIDKVFRGTIISEKTLAVAKELLPEEDGIFECIDTIEEGLGEFVAAKLLNPDEVYLFCDLVRDNEDAYEAYLDKIDEINMSDTVAIDLEKVKATANRLCEQAEEYIRRNNADAVNYTAYNLMEELIDKMPIGIIGEEDSDDVKEVYFQVHSLDAIAEAGDIPVDAIPQLCGMEAVSDEDDESPEETLTITYNDGKEEVDEEEVAEDSYFNHYANAAEEDDCEWGTL